MACNGTKFLGAITVPTGGWDIEIYQFSPPGTPSVETIAAGTYYLSGDGSSTDFLQEFETRFNAGLTAEGVAATATISIGTDGIVSIALDASSCFFTLTGGDTQAICRLTVLFVSAAAPSVGSRAAQYFAHSDVPTRVDIPTSMGRISRSEADDGSVNGNDLGPEIDKYRVAVRYTGPARSSTATGYDEWKDFFNLVFKKTKLLRWYPDATVTTAWVRFTNHNGYHVVKELEMKQFTPASVIQDSYSWYVTTMMLQVQP